jgi:ABC-type antimicrobial peptide transport system permease subunit
VLILMSAFGLIALVLTSAGILAILSQVVAQRTREIGVRVALGATRRNVLQLIVGRGMALTAIGIAIGLGGAAMLTRVLAGLLYEVAPLDPLSFLGAVAGLALAALIACLLPTRRALRIQPAEALRE